jgi:histidyl-tRNA synthetase
MIRNLPGFRDFYPADCAVRNHLFRVFRQTAHQFGFLEYDGPVLESLELFTEKSGEEIVGQLFNFEDKGGRAVALRPEMTPSMVRMVGAHANSLRKPIKWFSIGEQFRFERPQKGRLRSFYQFNGDILGIDGCAADAEAMALLVAIFKALGLTEKDVQIRLSDRMLWMYYLEGWGIQEEDRVAVLGVVDKLARRDRTDSLKALEPYLNEQSEDFLSQVEVFVSLRTLDALEAFFKTQKKSIQASVHERLAVWRTLLKTLQAFGLSSFFHIDLTIVRGLAYYTGFVFEAFESSGQSRALAGGGRYDDLVKKMGGPDLPALGFAIGDVTLRDLLEEKKLLPEYVDAVDFYAVFGSDAQLAVALEDIAILRERGLQVSYPLKPTSFNKQFKHADQAGARFALIYGEDEVARGVVSVRDLARKVSVECPRDALVEVLWEIKQGHWPSLQGSE